MPWYFRFPECGAAETIWDGDYYSLPDAEFVAQVEAWQPCVQALIAAGEAEAFEFDEVGQPECLEGRNPYLEDGEQRGLRRVHRLRLRLSARVARVAVACAAVRTRTLLLLAVVCGSSILVAGVVQLLRVAGQDEPPRPSAIGETVRVGDMDVTVEGVSERPGSVLVDVELGGVDDTDGADGFTLTTPGGLVEPDPTAGNHCGATTHARRAVHARLPASATTPARPGSCSTSAATNGSAGSCRSSRRRRRRTRREVAALR